MLLQDDVSGCEMSDKTPGQAAFEECYKDIDQDYWQHTDVVQKANWERFAMAAINNVRPQIEREARAAAVRDAVLFFMPKRLIPAALNRCETLASAPPGYVCVPVEFVQTMEKIAKYPESLADEWSAESYREMARKALAAARQK